ncbi:hypothetical protein, partial [Janthinobacterium sp. HH103]
GCRGGQHHVDGAHTPALRAASTVASNSLVVCGCSWPAIGRRPDVPASANDWHLFGAVGARRAATAVTGAKLMACTTCCTAHILNILVPAVVHRQGLSALPDVQGGTFRPEPRWRRLLLVIERNFYIIAYLFI